MFQGEPSYDGSSNLYVMMDKPLTTSGNIVRGAAENQPVYQSRETGSGDGSISLATAVAAVPEPATWAMMLVGFGMVGATARYRRRRIATVYA